LRVVPEAPDEVFFPRRPDAVDFARSEVGLALGESYFVFAGGVSPHKNVETLLHAYARLSTIHESVPRLVIVGDLTTDSFLSSAAAVKSLVTTLGLEGSVLLPGYVDDAVLASLYSGATAVVIPSLAEGFGLPAVEGAACGATMVLSDLPAHRETLDGGALFFPPTEPEALTTVLVWLLDNPDRAAEIAARGQSRARALSWDDAVEPLRDLIADAAGVGATA
jgi:glycosyltransferase involved in cell wall biosynthesis